MQRKISEALKKRLDIITVRYWLTIGLLTPAMIMAEANATDCELHMQAMINGQPAMTAVNWKVFAGANPTDGATPVYTTKKHSDVTSLACASYYITATRGTLTRTRTVTLIDGTNNVVIDLGA